MSAYEIAHNVLRQLAGSMQDNAPDQEDAFEIAHEYQGLACVHRAIAELEAYFGRHPELLED